MLRSNAPIQEEFFLKLAAGREIRSYTIAGRKDSLSQTALDDLSEIPATVVIPRPGGLRLEVVSSHAEDKAGGTGCQSLDIHYLDSLGVEQCDTVVPAGLVPVQTTAVTAIDIADVQWIHTKTVGSGGVAAGNITLRTIGGAGSDFEYLSAGGNQSLSCRYRIPAGWTGYIHGWQASGIAQRIDQRLRATVERFDRSLLPGVFLFQDTAVCQASILPYRPFPVPLMCPAGADIKVSATSGAAAGDGGASFTVILIKD